jgi:hypothetical protein
MDGARSMQKVIRQRMLALFVLLLSISSASCYFVRPTSLPGRYRAYDDWGEAFLELRADGTTLEIYKPKSGKEVQLPGRWTYDKELGGWRQPCLGLSHEKGYGGTPYGYCGIHAHGYGLRGVEIAIDPDYGLAYRKIN